MKDQKQMDGLSEDQMSSAGISKGQRTEVITRLVEVGGSHGSPCE